MNLNAPNSAVYFTDNNTQYGIRDSSGIMQYANSDEVWSPFGTDTSHFIHQGGNSFGTAMTIATLDNNDIVFKRNNIVMGLLGINNITFGTGLYSLTSGYDNVGVGLGALQGLTSGVGNIGIGQIGGAYITTGNYNIAIGHSTSQTITGDKNIVIGAGAEITDGSAHGQLSIQNIIFGTGNLTGGNQIGAGNIGIGTRTPSTRLEVAGTVKMTGFQMTASPTSGYVLTSDGSGNGTWQAASGASGWGLVVMQVLLQVLILLVLQMLKHYNLKYKTLQLVM